MGLLELRNLNFFKKLDKQIAAGQNISTKEAEVAILIQAS